MTKLPLNKNCINNNLKLNYPKIGIISYKKIATRN